ncbi:mucin-5AC-like [Chironomus tepperi]|uniref:mucin-5AC-like n=1 Tax=Chironomus tepperi TaxID=113505 RepID=UPI00391EF130
MRNFIIIFVLQILIDISASDYTAWDASTYVPDVCVCAPAGKCSYAGEAPNTDGSGIIEARILTLGENPKDNLGTNKTLCQPVSTGIPLVVNDRQSCDAGLELCCPSVGYSCGIRYPPIEGSPVPTGEQAPYGAYPYQAVILSSYNLYIASGVLIDQFHVLTVAHKVYNLSSGVKVRMGDWDAASSSEPLESIERNVTIFIHPNFTLPNLKNNIAILRLNSMIPLGQYPTIGTVCLPNTTLDDLRCWVSGWGKNATGKNGRYQRIIKQVDVPLIDQSTCLNMLRATVLGSRFVLDTISFVCAGGEKGKDACTGDGGAPLSCFVGDRFYLQGLVAWGLKCGSPGIPGVYVNVRSFIPWIQNMTKWLSSQRSSTTTLKSTPRTTVTVKNFVTTTARTGSTSKTRTTPKGTTTTGRGTTNRQASTSRQQSTTRQASTTGRQQTGTTRQQTTTQRRSTTAAPKTSTSMSFSTTSRPKSTIKGTTTSKKLNSFDHQIMIKIILTCLSLLSIVSCQVTSTNFTDGTNVPNVCLCATSGQCPLAGGGGANDGSGIINPRILNTGGVNVNMGTNISMCQPVTTGVKLAASDQSSCGDGLDLCCPEVGYTCGVSYPPIADAPQAATGQAPYGAYPYHVAIYSADNKYLGGGALIDNWNVLTAAHIIANSSKPITVKIGYWDLTASQEPLDRVTLTSAAIMMHPNFTAASLRNNIAIIRLNSAVALGQLPTIGSICLPSAPISGIRCMLSGWGGQGASAPTNILKHVDLPLLDSPTCQRMLRTTRLNKTFTLDTNSFICAGGEKGKDACAGDGGSPLSCYIVDRYYLVGVVSWGIGCGQQGIPGVYTNVINYIPWIQKTTAQLQSSNPSKLTTTASAATTKGTTSTTTTTATTTTVDGKVTKSAPSMTDSTTERTTPTTTTSTTPTTTSTTKTTTTTTSPTISSISSTLSTVLSTIANSLSTTIGTTATTTGSSTTKASDSSTTSTTASPTVTTTTTQSTTTKSEPSTSKSTTTSTSNTTRNATTTTTSGSTTQKSNGTTSGTRSTTANSASTTRSTTSNAASTTKSSGAVNSTTSGSTTSKTGTTTPQSITKTFGSTTKSSNGTTTNGSSSRSSTTTTKSASSGSTTTTNSFGNGSTSTTKSTSNANSTTRTSTTTVKGTSLSSNGTATTTTKKTNSTGSATSTTITPTTKSGNNSATSTTKSGNISATSTTKSGNSSAASTTRNPTTSNNNGTRSTTSTTKPSNGTTVKSGPTTTRLGSSTTLSGDSTTSQARTRTRTRSTTKASNVTVKGTPKTTTKTTTSGFMGMH